MNFGDLGALLAKIKDGNYGPGDATKAELGYCTMKGLISTNPDIRVAAPRTIGTTGSLSSVEPDLPHVEGLTTKGEEVAEILYRLRDLGLVDFIG